MSRGRLELYTRLRLDLDAAAVLVGGFRENRVGPRTLPQFAGTRRVLLSAVLDPAAPGAVLQVTVPVETLLPHLRRAEAADAYWVAPEALNRHASVSPLHWGRVHDEPLRRQQAPGQRTLRRNLPDEAAHHADACQRRFRLGERPWLPAQLVVWGAVRALRRRMQRPSGRGPRYDHARDDTIRAALGYLRRGAHSATVSAVIGVLRTFHDDDPIADRLLPYLDVLGHALGEADRPSIAAHP